MAIAYSRSKGRGGECAAGEVSNPAESNGEFPRSVTRLRRRARPTHGRRIFSDPIRLFSFLHCVGVVVEFVPEESLCIRRGDSAFVKHVLFLVLGCDMSESYGV